MSTTTTTESAYIPGVCNINHKEVAYRRKAGYFGLGFFVVIAAAFLALAVNRWFYVLLFVPAFVAAIGFLQAKNKFCVAYGAGGQQNADDGSEKARNITDTDAVSKDKKRSRQMNLQAAGIAVIATAAAVVLLPLIRS